MKIALICDVWRQVHRPEGQVHYAVNHLSFSRSHLLEVRIGRVTMLTQSFIYLRQNGQFALGGDIEVTVTSETACDGEDVF